MSLKNYIKPIKLKFQSKSEISNEVFAFDFISSSKLDWKAGQHASFELKVAGKNRRKTFAITSAPNEPIITITTMIKKGHPDSFKESLLNLKRGELIKMRGPTGPMHISDLGNHYTLLATGIGVTPFRSILKQLELDGATNAKITMFYASGKSGHLFKEDFYEIKSVLKNLRIEYIYKPDRITGQLLEEVLGQDLHNTIFLLSGSASMVNSYKRTLQGLGVKRKNIKSTPFIGRVSRTIKAPLPKKTHFFD